MSDWQTHLGRLLATIVVAIAALCLLPIFGRTAPRGVMTRNLSNAKQLGLGVRLYAQDHEGRFPLHLSELAPDYIPAEGMNQLLFAPQKTKDKSEPPQYDWLYFGAFTDEKHPPRILIASPRAIYDQGRNRRVIVRGDISGQVVFEEEYQAELAKTIEELKTRTGARTPSPPDAPKPGRVESEAPRE